jgi:hypothetical protein
MRHITALASVLAATTALLAQSSSSQPYQPVVPSGSSFSAYGAYPGYSTGGTVEGNALKGMASVISAKGDYNLSTSAAAVNMTQAQKQDIQNRQAATHAYFDMQATNRAGIAAKRSPRLSQEQLVRIAADSAPEAIDLNPVSGQVSWPAVLQDQMFAQERAVVQQLLGKQAQYGGLGLSDRNQAGQAIESMSNKLRDEIRKIPSQEYIESKNFLKGLMYSMTQTQLG